MNLKHIAALILAPLCAFAQTAEVKDLAIQGGVADGKAKLTIEGTFGAPASEQKIIYSTSVRQWTRVSREKIRTTIEATLEILQGEPKELTLTLAGEGELKEVTGEGLQDWGIRQEPGGPRTLILRPKKGDKPLAQLTITIIAERDMKTWKTPVSSFTVTPPQAGLFNGFVRIESTPDFDVKVEGATGLLPLEPKYLPEPMRGILPPEDPEPLAFQFHGAAYTLPLKIAVADPETRQVVLRDFKLTGQLAAPNAAFVLTATARVANPKGGSLTLLSGGIALTELPKHADWRITATAGRYVLNFDKAGEYPVSFKFNAAVNQNGPWNSVNFRVAPSALQPIALQGLAADTQFDFAGAARPERVGENFQSFLPPDGSVKLSWKTAPPEAEGRLFYAAEMLTQISVGPGIMRQTALLDFRVMQGELSSVVILLRGAGELTSVVGDHVLGQKVEPGANPNERKLTVTFNQPQKDSFTLQVKTQTPVGAFPQTVDAMELRPENATRFSGYFRIVNAGAVRLEVVQSKGLSQVSPEQFPETDRTKAVFPTNSSQRFAYRFSGAEFALRIGADQILPELTVSEILAYHHGENELSVDAELELDIREAPLRELLLRVPKGYVIAKLTAAGMVDHFQRDAGAESEIGIVYGQPVSGRQIVQLRIERNAALGAAEWVLPRVEVVKAKSTRGHIAASADAGFRLTAGRTQALTEVATAFFPRKVQGIQAAFRLSEPAWAATLNVERLPQSIQADALHLFSIGEGIAYGSSVLNYVISGSPIAAFKVELSDEYFNVEFIGKDIRSWKKADGGFLVQLHTPVSGAYTLLATYERPFKSQGDTLAFTGARPLDAQSEQGHTLVISAYQFLVKPVTVSPGLLPLETGEVPPEYRLFFDAPILAAYRYAARPFDLKLELSPLAQGDSIRQVVDRASLTTHISKEGQAVTDAHYFVKNRGNSHFRVSLPPDTQLWSTTVNDANVVPVTDANANLIPLPQQADPNAVLAIKLKFASRAKDPRNLSIATPTVSAPVMLADWKLEPDTAQRLTYRSGTLAPVGGLTDASGFAMLARVLENDRARATTALIGVFFLLVMSIIIWRKAKAAPKFSARYSTGLTLGCIAFLIACYALFVLADISHHQRQAAPSTVAFLAPVQQPGSALTAEISNVPVEESPQSFFGGGWLVLLAVVAWLYSWIKSRREFVLLGWLLLAWAALRSEDGEGRFFAVIGFFAVLHIAIPALRSLRRTAVAALLFCGFVAFGNAQELPKDAPVAETVVQTIRVDEKFALAMVKIHWQAEKGQRLPLLFDPAVLTKATLPEASLKLIVATADKKRAQHLLALESGTFDVELSYQIAVMKKDGASGFTLPTQFGLVNTLTLTLANLDVDVSSPHAVSVSRTRPEKDTVATLVLAPANDAWIAWKPRSRDISREKAKFHTELTQLYVPTAGAVEGLHHVTVRPEQGELAELVLSVPKGATITDVIDPITLLPAKDNKVAVGIVSQWRFDPDTGKLRVGIAPAQSRAFALLIRSQVATGPLPVTQSVGLIALDGAATQIGMVGFATGNEVQLDDVASQTLTAINLEDFPGNLATALASQIPGLTVRRSFRYSDVKATAILKATAVEPDVRVESQDTLSLGEDRTLLAINANVEITRAGIFKLSFALPAGMDVESIAGKAVSHWTEAKAGDARIITMHLNGRTEGAQQFAISLTGPGMKAVKAWPTPQLVFREASKQRGTFVVVPEQGMRLQVAKREGVTQLDPQKSGIKQKGVLAFRVLQTPWSLALDVEQVDAWVQVTSLQHALIGEAQVKVTANLQYQIENTGLKSFRVTLPAGAESVKFTGDQVADFLLGKDGVWEVKLHRRVIGAYFLQATYQTPLAPQSAETSIVGVQVADVNKQGGFVTVQSSGRLQLRATAVPPALQPAEWQSIPRALLQDLAAASASFTYRLVEPAFVLPFSLQRYEATKLLPARVNSITLKSVIADSGAMLTEVRMEMLPGDKRLLAVTLPKDATFWFAYVNRNGVWPWREKDQILIPLEQQSKSGEAIPVTLFYSSQIGKPDDLELLAPKFDLPLENIVWNVYLNEKWNVHKWTGTLQMQEERVVQRAQSIDVQSYLSSEVSQKQEKTKAAEQQLVLGNKALEQGNTQQARAAFGNAFNLSQHDQAFNEDARVQLHNLKLQQAIVGLNVRKTGATGENDAISGKLRAAENRDNTYSQQEAKQLIDSNGADENAALLKCAERLIQQQDAAVSAPAVIQANIPEQGRLLTFSRSVAVDTQADLQIGIEAKTRGTASWFARVSTLAITAFLMAVAALLMRGFKQA